MNGEKKSTGFLKRAFDLGFSGIFFLTVWPVLFGIAVIIKATSKGSALYPQERLGKDRKPFMMYKFRTMHENAEEHGPQLAKPDDPRITKFGRFLRKYHLDEMMQFWNVLKGEMSIVGPRPEREYYATQIEKLDPGYSKIYTVKPGITSLGMVKYGYASDINKMLERSRFDIDYVENLSSSLDMKIMGETVKTILKGKGI